MTNLKRDSSEVDVFLKQRPGGERLLLFLCLPSVVSGTIYGFTEHLLTGAVKDLLFIVILAVATVFLSVSVMYLRRLLTKSAVTLYRDVSADKVQKCRIIWVPLFAWNREVRGPSELLMLIFDRKAMSICGFLYGLVLGQAPLLFGVFQNDRRLQLLLCLFMFCSNAVTGAVFYSLVTLLRQSWYLAKHLDVGLFFRRTKAVEYYSALLARASIIGAIYIGFCQASVIFSLFSGERVYGYAFFAFVVFLALFYGPQIPIRERLRQERDDTLAKLNRTRDSIFAKEPTRQDLDDLYKLSELERKISTMSLSLGATDEWLVRVAGLFTLLSPYMSDFAKLIIAAWVEHSSSFLNQLRAF